MEKRFTKKIIAAFAVATLFVGVALAQVEATGDYTQYDANVLVPTNTEYVSVGATMGYYAVPDAVYHPSYALGGPYTLTAGFTWDWTVPTEPAPGDATVIYPVATFPANYGRVTYGATGSYIINVAETSPASFGGCADATPTVMNVTAVALPTGTMSIAPAGWQTITANQSYQICGDQAAETVTIAFNEAVPDAMGSYSFQITETIENLNGADAVTATPQAETIVQDFPLASKVKGANLGTLTNAAFATATPAFTFTFDSDALNITGAARTRYTYKVARSGEATGTANIDFVSNISHKSDYLALGGAFDPKVAFTVSTVSFIVNPAPVTGPIYHISNTLRL